MVKVLHLPNGKVLEFRCTSLRLEFACFASRKHYAKRWCVHGGSREYIDIREKFGKQEAK